MAVVVRGAEEMVEVDWEEAGREAAARAAVARAAEEMVAVAKAVAERVAAGQAVEVRAAVTVGGWALVSMPLARAKA